jgi:hypothetical protein
MIIYRTPKSGSSSVVENLINAQDRSVIYYHEREKKPVPKSKHYILARDKLLMNEKQWSRFDKTDEIMTMVRNPWERAVSIYFYTFKKKRMRVNFHRGEKLSFVQFLEMDFSEMEKRCNYTYWHAIQQLDFFKLHYNKIDYIVDYTAEPVKTMEFIHEKLGFEHYKGEIRHSKKNRNTDYRDYYDDYTLKLIEHKYDKDMRLAEFMGYSFENKFTDNFNCIKRNFIL